ncbi:LGFP repeat-containing protein [Kineococcus sp. TBRC 1896]|uniref:LGFP repeat-containing protein n=1 Tax=Kineococcus mangrovi TaxID=1660183 RepID=A0ABV4I461_9ACTN
MPARPVRLLPLRTTGEAAVVVPGQRLSYGDRARQPTDRSRAELGWEQGPVGYPVTDELGTPDGVGRARWAQLGWEHSPLGHPTSGEVPTPDGVEQHVQGGTTRWTRADGALTVTPG